MNVLKGILCSMALMLTVPAWCSSAEEPSSVLDTMVVTATKYETPLKEIPASVTVIRADDIAKQNLPNGDIGDVLRSVVGITTRRAYAPFPTYPNIRGMGSDATVILVNGIPTNWEITQAIPTGNIERIEILRGPASALYGANASGGVVNIILKKGKKTPESRLGTSYGRFETLGIYGDTQGAVNKFNYAMAASYEDSDGANVVQNNLNPSIKMIDTCDYSKKKFSMNTGYDLTDDSKISFFYNFLNDEYTRGRPHVGGDWDRHMAGLNYSKDIGERLAVTAYAGFRYDDLLHLYDKGGTNYDGRQKRYTDFYETPAELRLTANAGGNHMLTTGFAFNETRTDQDYNDWTTGALTQENEYKVRTLAGYLQDVWHPIAPLSIHAGVRYDHWKNFDNYFSSYNDESLEDRTDSQWSPRVGMRYQFTDEMSGWMNYGTGFTPPTSVQLYDDRTSGGNPREPNPDLEPEKTKAWEIGLEKWMGRMAQASVVGYYNITDDKILSWFNDSNVWVNKNIGKTKSYGTEISLALYLSQNWTINANYTYTHATIEDNPSDTDKEGNYLTFTPKNKANIGVTYAQPGNFSINVTGRYLGEQFCSDTNAKENANGESLIMEESFVCDLKVIKQFKPTMRGIKGIDFSLSVDNLFDEEYRTYYMYEDPGTVLTAQVDFIF